MMREGVLGVGNNLGEMIRRGMLVGFDVEGEGRHRGMLYKDGLDGFTTCHGIKHTILYFVE